MKIYTRTGDDGTTGLLGPGRVSKSAPRVEAYGTVDELNAVLGTVRAIGQTTGFAAELEIVQNALFAIGAALASTAPGINVAHVTDADVVRLEGWIDTFEAELTPLKSFILPAGTALAAQLHLARTVCRRAERRTVALAREEAVAPEVIRYLNRLADLLFVMARLANAQAGTGDVEWHPRPAS